MAIKLQLVGLSVIAAAAVATACSGPIAPRVPSVLPEELVFARNGSPIQHVVIVIQENRSFDNLFATFPGADGTRTGEVAAMSHDEAQFCRSRGMPVIAKATSVPLKETDLFGSGFGHGNFAENSDLDHIHSGYAVDRDDGKMDGFDLVGTGADGSGTPACTYAYQYVKPSLIAPYWAMAKQYVLADHLFQTQGSGSFTAHQDLIAAGTRISDDEALINNPTYFPWGCDANKSVRTAIIKKNGHVYPYGGPFPCLKYATLRDLLNAKSLSWKFYAVAVQKESGCHHGDTAGIWSAFDAIKAVRYSPEWRKNVSPYPTDFFTDLGQRQLSAVSWITPDGANSDHPAEYAHKGCSTPGPTAPPVDNGPSWVASIVNAIGESPYWKSTAVVVLWDDWGGFYDHVAPPLPLNWQGGPGFRVPMLIVSPYVKHHVDHTTYQFGSVLRFIEDNWALGSLGGNDAHSRSIANAFDYAMKPRPFHKIGSSHSVIYFVNQQPSGVAPDSE